MRFIAFWLDCSNTPRFATNIYHTAHDLYVNPPPKLCSLFLPPAVTFPSLRPVSNAHGAMSSFLACPVGKMSKSKISIGKPIVVHAFGMSTIPATWPWIGAHESRR